MPSSNQNRFASSGKSFFSLGAWKNQAQAPAGRSLKAYVLRIMNQDELNPAHFRPIGFEGNTMLKLTDNLLI